MARRRSAIPQPAAPLLASRSTPDALKISLENADEHRNRHTRPADPGSKPL